MLQLSCIPYLKEYLSTKITLRNHHYVNLLEKGTQATNLSGEDVTFLNLF